MTAEKQIIQRDDAKIRNQILNYKTAVSKVNTLLKAFTDAGYNLDDRQANEFCQKNFNNEALQAVEDAKVIKEIEERYSVYAEGVQLDVFNELQAIAEQINTVLPKLKQSVFNRRLDFRYLFKEDAEGKVIPHLDFIDFSDL